MKFKRKLYPPKNHGVIRSSGKKEIDLRSNFQSIIFGDGETLPHGKKILLRVFRLDSNRKRIKCTCLSDLSLEPSDECKFCLGEGYFWDEHWKDSYCSYVGADGGLSNRTRMLKPGEIRTDYKVFYFEHSEEIKYCDKIIEVKLDSEGQPVVPYVIETIYKPETISVNRSDYGRAEYISAYCKEQDSIREDY